MRGISVSTDYAKQYVDKIKSIISDPSIPDLEKLTYARTLSGAGLLLSQSAD